MQTNAALQLAFDFVQYTNQHIFLTGKAGTGKTTFLHNLKLRSPKRMIVVAPTGVAAINAGGVTIHSFFQIGFGPQIGENAAEKERRFNREKINIIRTLDLLVIDEISMVRADLLDAIDAVLRRFRTRNKPFGGVQLLMIGDLQQLSPVVKEDEWSLLRAQYDTPYFFSSRALRETSFTGIELTHVFRQQDEKFISMLNKVRENRLDAETLDALNARYIPNFEPQTEEGYITLCTHNAQAQRINESKLNLLSTKKEKFTAKITGNFPEYAYPTEFELTLKVDSQVMFVKNDPSKEKLFFNGKIGKITRFDDDKIYVKCPDDLSEIPVEPLDWENVKYSINETTNEITETVEGSFTQYPLKLAWAITIHKSQGLTFERAIIDAEASFAHGQVYVALSRCKTLEGMVLSSKINNRSVINDGTVTGFIRQVEENQPNENHLSAAKLAYQHELLSELFRFSRLRYLSEALLKIADGNSAAVLSSLTDNFRQMLVNVEINLLDVGNKFQTQIAQMLSQNPDAEKNEALQERVKKGSHYFIEKIKTDVVNQLAKCDLDIDNQAVKKQLKDTVSKITEEIKLKIVCMEACADSFTVKKLLDARANAVIEKALPKTSGKVVKAEQSDKIPHPELYEILRAWRSAKADELNVLIYQIFPQKTLFELAYYLPTDERSLKAINGFGSARIRQFGIDIVEIIHDYCVEKKLEKPELVFAEKKEKEPKTDSKQVTFDLFKQGKKIAEIAAERGFAVSTIEGHLAHFVAQGELDISLFLTDEKLKRAADYFLRTENKGLSEARQALGEEFSYSELRMALSHITLDK